MFQSAKLLSLTKKYPLKPKQNKVFAGYCLLLPLDKLENILGSEEDWELLWLYLLTETVRRTADSIFKFDAAAAAVLCKTVVMGTFLSAFFYFFVKSQEYLTKNNNSIKNRTRRIAGVADERY